MKASQSRLLIIALMLFSFFASSLVATKVLHDFPSSADEYSYLFGAKTFLKGKLWNEPYPDPDFFQTWHITSKEGKLLTRYSPGWPSILAAFMFFKIPSWMVNPILSALLVWVLYLFGRRFYGEKVAIIATVSVMVSAFFLLNAGSYFTHIGCSLFITLFFYFAFRFFEEDKPWQGILAGMFIAIAFSMRYYTAMMCGFMLLIHPSFYNLRRIGCFLAGGVPILGLNLLYNFLITGDPFTNPIGWYDKMEFEFSISAMNFAEAKHAFLFIVKRFPFWVNPALLLFYPLYLIWVLRERRLRAPDLCILSLMGGYGLIGFFSSWAHGGNQFGPRYYFESYPFIAFGAVSLMLSIQNKNIRNLFLGVFALGAAFSLYQIPYHLVKEHHVTVERMDPFTLAEKQGLKNAVVILTNGTGKRRWMDSPDLTRNEADITREVLYVLDQKERNPELLKWFPDREFYLYLRDHSEAFGRLEKISLTDYAST